MTTRWWIAFVAALLLGVAGYLVFADGPATPPSRRLGPPPDRLKVVTYNTWGCRAGIEKILETLREQKADVIFLQEVGRRPNAAKADERDPPARIAKALGMHVVSASTLRVPIEQHCDQAILSRFELNDGKAHALDEGGWVFAVQATLKTKGRPLHLLSVHTHATFKLDVKHIYESSTTRLAEVTRLLEIVRPLNGDVIIAGDFNAAAWMPEYFLITKEWNDLGSISKEDKLSFPAWKPAVRIDYVFGRGEFAGRAYRLLNAHGSDHLPVAAELEREEPAGAPRTTTQQTGTPSR